MTYIRTTTRTAKRKSSRCDWCRDRIEVGEKYVDEVATYCGDFQALKFHIECRDACDKLAREIGEPVELGERFKRGTTEAI